MKSKRFFRMVFVMGTFALLSIHDAMASCTDTTKTSRHVGWLKGDLDTADGVKALFGVESATVNCTTHGGHMVWVMLYNGLSSPNWRWMQIGYWRIWDQGSERVFSQYTDDDYTGIPNDPHLHTKDLEGGNPVSPPSDTYRIERDGSNYVMKYGSTTWVTVPAADVDGWASNGVDSAQWCGETWDANDPIPGTENDPVRLTGCAYRKKGDPDYTTLSTNNHATDINTIGCNVCTNDDGDIVGFDLPSGDCHTGEGKTPNLSFWN